MKILKKPDAIHVAFHCKCGCVYETESHNEIWYASDGEYAPTNGQWKYIKHEYYASICPCCNSVCYVEYNIKTFKDVGSNIADAVFG